jgi:arginyl-tRNA synthetase
MVHMNSELYGKAQEHQLMLSVEKIITKIHQEFGYQIKDLTQANDCFKSVEGAKFLNFTLSYNLVLNLIMKLMDQSDDNQKKSLQELIENDICEMVEGKITDNKIKTANVK